MNKKSSSVRLQLSVLPRHIEILESLRGDYETNSLFIMRVLDTLKAKHEKSLSKEVDNDN